MEAPLEVRGFEDLVLTSGVDELSVNFGRMTVVNVHRNVHQLIKQPVQFLLERFQLVILHGDVAEHFYQVERGLQKGHILVILDAYLLG